VQSCVDAYGGVDGLAIPAADMSKETYDGDTSVAAGLDWDVWERTVQINWYGHAQLMHHTIPHLITSGGGPIVTVSSGSAYAGHVGDRPAYAGSKAGLHALVRHAARWCGKDNIRVNCVAPGLVMTDGARKVINDEIERYSLQLNALPRHGYAEDIANALAFFLSDESSWISGQVLSVNGGAVFRD
jgi:NAD(P)-dependent dehydrogenase (short-subunit alcohol dehydrogenase family)